MSFENKTNNEIGKYYVQLLEYMDGLLNTIEAIKEKYLESETEIKNIEVEFQKRNIQIKDRE
jgi:predicted  nucleic acid-binding Zn-ribbon protein